VPPEREADLFAKLIGRLSRVEGRIEEQSKFLQLALASRQTRQPTA